VAVPGAEGEFGVLANHVLLVAALRPGIAQRISELESRIEKTELGSDLDKLITRSITS